MDILAGDNTTVETSTNTINKNQIENLLIDKRADNKIIRSALATVETYIKKHALVLVGGMAIDLALRSRGGYLYDDNQLPDYDFVTDKYMEHAKKLVVELCKKFPDATVDYINAMHLTTLRVQINFETVADITYMPTSILEKMPTIKTAEFVVVHPWYQIADIHLSLSRPYNNAPNEVINHRWKKDMCRYELLYATFPVNNTELKLIFKNIKHVANMRRDIKIPLIPGACYTGITALNILDAIYRSATGTHMIEVKRGYINIADAPFMGCCEVFHPNIVGVSKEQPNGTMYNWILDKIPPRYETPDVVYYDASTIAEGACTVKISDQHVVVAGLQTTMYMTLIKLFLQRSDLYSLVYSRCVELIDAINSMLDVSTSEKLLNSGYFPLTTTYGTYISPQYQYYLHDFAGKLKYGPMYRINLRPRNQFPQSPECGLKMDVFDYSGDLYDISGEVISGQN